MNERILELALKAGLREAVLLAHWGKIEALTDSEQDGLDAISYFAELIVRKCMNVASPSYMNTPEQGVYYVDQAINRIAEHFGVEE